MLDQYLEHLQEGINVKRDVVLMKLSDVNLSNKKFEYALIDTVPKDIHKGSEVDIKKDFSLRAYLLPPGGLEELKKEGGSTEAYYAALKLARSTMKKGVEIERFKAKIDYKLNFDVEIKDITNSNIFSDNSILYFKNKNKLKMGMFGNLAIAFNIKFKGIMTRKK